MYTLAGSWNGEISLMIRRGYLLLGVLVVVIAGVGGNLAMAAALRGDGQQTEEPQMALPEPPLPPQDDQTNHADGSVTLRLGPANIQTFQQPSLQALARSYIKLSGVDMGEDKLIDDFAAISHCPLFSRYFRNEFVWRQAREAVRKSIERDLETFPEYFLINGTIEIGRYDFVKHAFDLPEAARMERTGRFELNALKPPDLCLMDHIDKMPRSFTFRLTNPVTMENIPVAESLAIQVTREMDRRENYSRRLYVSFYFRVNDFNSRIGGRNEISRAIVRSTLLSLRFYLDKERTLLIYDHRPH